MRFKYMFKNICSEYIIKSEQMFVNAFLKFTEQKFAFLQKLC